jgi:hypothetical protein
VDLTLSHPEAHYAARITDQDASGSWEFAGESACTFDDGTLRVQIEMPPAMRHLVEAARSATTAPETLVGEECVSQR